jgi:hypothetical protein
MSRRARDLASVSVVLVLASVTLAADPPNPIGYPKKVDTGGGDSSIRIWYEDGTWHLRTTTEGSGGKKDKEKVTLFTGSVHCEGKVTTEGVKLEKGAGKHADAIVPHADGKGFDFRFQTRPGTDEVAFKVAGPGKPLKFKLMVNGQKALPDRIFIGANGEHPEKNEFQLPARPR